MSRLTPNSQPPTANRLPHRHQPLQRHRRAFHAAVQPHFPSFTNRTTITDSTRSRTNPRRQHPTIRSPQPSRPHLHPPTVSSEITGELEMGDVVELVDLRGTDEVWVQIEPAKWVLFAYNGQPLLKKVT
ncbi:MAG: hypothetical protein U9R58_00510 [Chloroflexota bacterium]|nr:hypothetical protein [Chloroflexota bacterium]